jgi:hypothetical protein
MAAGFGMFRIFEEEPSELTITEFIALISLGYLVVSGAFNVGYFNQVPGHFVELFSLQDLFATNLPVLQYIFTVFFLYSVCVVITFWQLNRAVDWLAEKMKALSSIMFSDSILEKLIMLLFILLVYLIAAIVGLSKIKSFALLMLPPFLFHGAMTYLYFAAWRSGSVRYRSLLYVALLNLVMFSYTSGGNWVEAAIADQGDLQSFQTKDGNCFDRKLMRAAGGGVLLYNPSMKQFEIRARDDFRSIFPSLGCL